jgi:histidine triad (HIT) family protein
MEDCIFCKIIAGKIPAKIIDQNNDVIVFLSLENHPLVIPKKHIQDIYEMDDETASEVMKEAVKIARAVKKGLNADGVNLLQSNESAAGQDVFHFHLHVRPRFKSDKTIFEFNNPNTPEDEQKTTLEKIKQALE